MARIKHHITLTYSVPKDDCSKIKNQVWQLAKLKFPGRKLGSSALIRALIEEEYAKTFPTKSKNHS